MPGYAGMARQLISKALFKVNCSQNWVTMKPFFYQNDSDIGKNTEM